MSSTVALDAEASVTLTAPIFEIQRFSLHDGPGIRSLVFFKGCALHCPWCQNPESQAPGPVIAFYRDRCTESFECEKSCPDGAIEREGFRINYERCSNCGRCVEACAYGALRLIGETFTPEQLMARLLVDQPYYESSGGGVTFSGGEPTLHLHFLDRVLDLCSQASVHTNLETSGTFSFERSESVLRKFDLIYFDFKILDPELHRDHLGGGYAAITQNAEHLVRSEFPVEFRLPLIPGHTDTNANIERVIERLEHLGQNAVHLLRYHNMGETKIDIIAGKQPKLGLARYSDENFETAARTFERRGVEILNRH